MSAELFLTHSYLNLESFRKSGQGVKTPVWFVQEDSKLYVWTEARSGKARRVRNNARVNLAPCKGNGDLLGAWVSATAVRDDSPAAQKHVRSLMVRKYGWVFHVFTLLGKLRGSDYTTLQLTF